MVLVCLHPEQYRLDQFQDCLRLYRLFGTLDSYMLLHCKVNHMKRHCTSYWNFCVVPMEYFCLIMVGLTKLFRKFVFLKRMDGASGFPSAL